MIQGGGGGWGEVKKETNILVSASHVPVTFTHVMSFNFCHCHARRHHYPHCAEETQDLWKLSELLLVVVCRAQPPSTVPGCLSILYILGWDSKGQCNAKSYGVLG